MSRHVTPEEPGDGRLGSPAAVQIECRALNHPDNQGSPTTDELQSAIHGAVARGLVAG